ncbi:sugar ABC transporter substrate-binding protein [Arsenicicoccus bolidensis]|uniref:sugar ABC transporter substrate-binding protein n=1 Tax=Arsenicicoccus bolidensis TaxID=229480 RepID=UPI001969C45B|nr:sugar ABC transporter substrate-binding protein [Arsenicicoccus bolidensis]
MTRSEPILIQRNSSKGNPMSTRKIAVLSLAFAAAIPLSACNRDSSATSAADSGGKPVVIGLAVANLQADFFNQIKQSVEAEASAKGVKVQVSDAGGDSATQVNQIQDFISRQVSAIIYIPAGATAAGVPVKAAQRANIPVINVDRNAPDAPGKTFIATDSVAAAKTLGDWVVKQQGGKGNIAILQGQIGTTPQVDRQKGFQEALNAAPGMKVIAQQPADWAQDKGFNVAQDMIQAHQNINVFWGQADAMALGAAQAASNANLNPKPLIVGFDGDKAGIQAVRDGKIDATMVQQTQLMGRLAVDAAIKLAKGEQVPAQQLQTATLLTKADRAKADEFLAKHP